MSDRRLPDSDDESEFGLGLGMIDSTRRADRALEPHEFAMEIKALPKTFDGSELGLPGATRGEVETTPVPRLLPGEEASNRD